MIGWCTMVYHSIPHVRQSLPDDGAWTVACSIVTSQIYYSNSLYAGMSASNYKKLLQRVGNISAQVVLQLRCRDHITPALVQLHWLPARHRVTFKIATITFNLLKFHRPSYLYQFVQPYTSSRNLRSLNQNLLSAGGKLGPFCFCRTIFPTYFCCCLEQSICQLPKL